MPDDATTHASTDPCDIGAPAHADAQQTAKPRLAGGNHQIMISHRMKDTGTTGTDGKGGNGSALRLAQFLRNEGYTVFLDTEPLQIASEWSEVSGPSSL